MRLHSEEMKPFEKSCSNCYYKFEQPCTKNNHGRCLRKGKFKFWRDYYDCVSDVKDKIHKQKIIRFVVFVNT